MQAALLILLLILPSSTCGAWLMLRQKQAEKPVKVMIFIGYFWLLTFVQLVLFALVYFIGQRFFPNIIQ